MTLSERQCDFTHALMLLIQCASSLGYRCKIVELNRTVSMQRQYVSDGKSKTMNSMHLYNLAVDIALFKDGMAITSGESFRRLGEYWESIGGRWGGRFGIESKPRKVQDKQLGWDCDHFEFRMQP